jgi:transcriptional regulator with XRE-family HTH domain
MTRRTPAGRWELASRLRALRREQGLTLDDVARELFCSPAKVSRLENGQRGAQVDDVRALSRIYGLSVAQTRELLALAKDVRSEPSWHLADASASGSVQKYVELEAAAELILWVEPLRIPGLLQTASYTTALLTRYLPITGETPPAKPNAALRLARQQRLFEDPPLRVDAIIDEAVVRRCVGGPDVMLEQVENLLRLARLAHVTLRLIPFDAGAHAAMEGSMVILRFTEEQRLPQCVFIEGLIGHIFYEDESSVARCGRAFELLTGFALSSAATQEFLLAVADDWRARTQESEAAAG